jgi:hypothetical protein
VRTLKPLIAWSVLALLCSLLFSGCFLLSSEPFYERGKTVYDPALLGTWHMKNCSDSQETQAKYCVLKFAPYESERDGKLDKGYTISLADDRGRSAEFEGFLFEVQGIRFLDTSVTGDPQVNLGFALHTITGHVPWKTGVAAGELTLTPIYRGLGREAAAAQPPLPTFQYEGDTVLAASTAELQAFLAKHALDPGSYDRPLVWKQGAPPVAARAPKKK